MPSRSTPRTLFGRRLREARLKMGIAQDKLGVMIGIDELTSSARISRYETGIHEPSFAIAERLSTALHVPAAFFYCENDDMAQLVVGFAALPTPARAQLLEVLSELSNA